jgi:hypothetical protein
MIKTLTVAKRLTLGFGLLVGIGIGIAIYRGHPSGPEPRHGRYCLEPDGEGLSIH